MLRFLNRVALFAAVFAAGASAVELKRETLAAFERYVRQAESRIQQQTAQYDGFLFASTPERRAGLRASGVQTAAQTPRGELRVPSGLIQDWVGAVFIPDARMSDVLTLVQSYDRHKDFYAPEVIDSKLIERDGDDFRVALRLLKRKVLTVVLDTEHSVRYRRRSEGRWSSESRSTRIVEIQASGTSRERALPPDTGHGFLWRLNSYWTFQELNGGVYVECEAISLSRDVPAGLRWLLDPIVRSLPRESLTHTLRATREGVLRLSKQ